MTVAADNGTRTIAGSFNTLSPWPPEEDALVHQADIPLGTTRIWLTSDRRARVELLSDVRVSILSGDLGLEPKTTYAFALRVRPGPDLALCISGSFVARSDDPDLQSQGHNLKPQAAAPITDFTQDNEAAIIARAEELAKVIPRADRRSMPPSYLAEGLQRELNQLQDLVGLYLNGRFDHIFGIAARVRILAARGRTMHPILQGLAAHIDVPLMMHAREHSPLSMPPTHGYFGSWAPTSTIDPSAREVDLDVWLNLEGAATAKKQYTNLQILAAIGNTVGAHFDPELEPLVELLESHHTTTEVGVISALDNWVYNTCIAMQQLGNFVLSEWQAANP